MSRREGNGNVALIEAERKAWDATGSLDFVVRARASGGRFVSKDAIEIPFLKGAYTVDRSARNFIARGAKEPPAPRRVLILHYILNASETTLAGRLVTVDEMKKPEGLLKRFQNLALRPLLQSLSQNIRSLEEKAELIGGFKAYIGEAAARFYPLPKTPVTLALWRSDERHPAEAQVFFDASIVSHLSAGDACLLAMELVGELVSLTK